MRTLRQPSAGLSEKPHHERPAHWGWCGVRLAVAPQNNGLPAPDGAFPKLHVFACLSDAQAMRFNHLHDSQFEVCVERSSRFRVVHGSCHFGFNQLPGCLFLLGRNKPLGHLLRSCVGAAKIQACRSDVCSEGNTMSAPHNDSNEVDPVEAIVPMIPMVLPLAGAVLIFLLAFIAVSMA